MHAYALVRELSGTDSKTGAPGTSKSPVLRGHQDVCVTLSAVALER